MIFTNSQDVIEFNDEIIPHDNRFSSLINLDKKRIAELYNSLGILDDLFPLTRSREKITDDFSHHCGLCWFCAERFWAFNRYE